MNTDWDRLERLTLGYANTILTSNLPEAEKEKKMMWIKRKVMQLQMQAASSLERIEKAAAQRLEMAEAELRGEGIDIPF